MTLLELKEFLDEKAEFYQQKEFIQTDPIIIPHEYDNKLDIEISGFLISIISWGNRKSIINSGYKIINFLESSPYDFIINHSDQDLKGIKGTMIYLFCMLKSLFTFKKFPVKLTIDNTIYQYDNVFSILLLVILGRFFKLGHYIA